ncbi:MAG: outer membrane protein assembly factor BamD [Myxococcota bacterium]
MRTFPQQLIQRSRRIRAERMAFVCLLVAVALTSCTNASTVRRSPSEQALGRYSEGMEELLSGNYTEAIGQFHRVVRSPGYVKYAALARLRIGDALFLQEKFDAAIETYRSFLRQYEGNPNSGYAQFRIGHAFFEQIPSGWFLAPPIYERQQTFVKHAATELRRFAQFYPTNRLVPQAQEMLDDCERLLFEHEHFAADFYRNRNKPKGVIIRLERAFRKYPEIAGSDEESYVMLAKAYADTERFDEARAMFASYLERFPDGSFRDQAEESLDALRTVQ